MPFYVLGDPDFKYKFVGSSGIYFRHF